MERITGPISTMLTGALVGAQVGLEGIPARFIDGLADREEILGLATALPRVAHSPEL